MMMRGDEIIIMMRGDEIKFVHVQILGRRQQRREVITTRPASRMLQPHRKCGQPRSGRALAPRESSMVRKVKQHHCWSSRDCIVMHRFT